MRLKYTEVKEFREQQLIRQGQCCSLCGEVIIDDAVLDHCHKTGKIRSVLHRGCNALLGKIENNMPRNRITMRRLEMISQNLVKYLEQEYADIVHPTYKKKEPKMPGRGRGKGKKPPKR